MEEVPCRTSLVPLAFPCLLHCLFGVETEGLLDYQGRAGDHFHCTVEPSPGHIRCRLFPGRGTQLYGQNDFMDIWAFLITIEFFQVTRTLKLVLNKF